MKIFVAECQHINAPVYSTIIKIVTIVENDCLRKNLIIIMMKRRYGDAKIIDYAERNIRKLPVGN